MPPQRTTLTRACARCGDEFAIYPFEVQNASRKYCSRGCARLARRKPMMPVEERFWRYVQKDEAGCWLWTGTRDDRGYGKINRSDAAVTKKRPYPAHRVAWELTYGPIPAGLLVRHFVCANPPCVRPDHLRLGSQKDNVADARRDGTMVCGSRSMFAKLHESDVSSVRRLLKDGLLHKEIAAMFGVKRATISQIARGKTWRHVS